LYQRGQPWSIAWVQNGAKQYELGFPDEDTARRVLAVRIGDLAARRGGLRFPKHTGPLANLVAASLEGRRGTHRLADQDEYRWRNHLALMRLVSTLYTDHIDDGKASKSRHRITKLIKAACKNAKLPRLTFYEAGRHRCRGWLNQTRKRHR
jgi:hypothetical protein